MGREVTTRWKVDEVDEIAQAQRVTEYTGRGPNPAPPQDHETRFFRMMEDIHTLARQPNGDALSIPNFCGSIPSLKNKASFTQWMYEMPWLEHPAGVVRSWIIWSLRGPHRDSKKPRAGPLQVILDMLDTMHGTVAPYDVMMRKLFNITQSKTEKVSCFDTRLGTEVADIWKDYPSKITKASPEDHQWDRFYQNLKMSLKDPLRYLYDTGEDDNFKEVEIAKAAHDDFKVLDELASLKAEVKKVWNESQTMT